MALLSAGAKGRAISFGVNDAILLEIFPPYMDAAGLLAAELKDARAKAVAEGHLPVRSYLAVPVVSRTGDVIGGLFFGYAAIDCSARNPKGLRLSFWSWCALSGKLSFVTGAARCQSTASPARASTSLDAGTGITMSMQTNCWSACATRGPSLISRYAISEVGAASALQETANCGKVLLYPGGAPKG